MKQTAITRAFDRPAIVVLTLLAALIAATFAAYLPGLGGPLLLDDLPQLKDLIDRSSEAPATLFNNFLISTSGPFGRPVAMATFIFDAVTHGPDTWWWKFNSLMLHLIAGLLLVWLVAAIVSALPEKPLPPWVAGLIVGALWLLHPLQLSAVLYTVQRMTILSTLFVFAGMLCYVKGRLRMASAPVPGWILIGTALLVFLPLAGLSKESGLLMLVYISLLELLIFRFHAESGEKRKLRLLHISFAGMYLAVAVYLLANPEFVLKAYEIRDFTLVERSLTQFRVIAAYLSQLILPLPFLLGFFHDDISVSSGLFDPATTFLSLLLVSALIAGAAALSKRAPLIAFGVLFYFASHALESSFFGLELMYEHRNYTGSAGMFIALAAVMSHLFSTRSGVYLTALMLTAGCAVVSWQRAVIWSTPMSMYSHMYAVHPQSERLNLLHTEIYASIGQFGLARDALSRVRPGLDRVIYELYVDCFQFGQVDDRSLQTAIRSADGNAVTPVVSNAIFRLIDTAVETNCIGSVDGLSDALDLLLETGGGSDRDIGWIYFAKARLLESAGRVDETVEAYERAQRISDFYAVPLYRAADTLVRAGRSDEARHILERAAEMEQHARIVRKDVAEKIYVDIGEKYIDAGQYEDAVETYREAMRSMPANPTFYVALAGALLNLERYGESREVLTELRNRGLAGDPGFAYRVGAIEKALEERPASFPAG